MNKAARTFVFQARHKDKTRSSFLSGWTLSIVLIALLIAAPILLVLASLFFPNPEIWQHLSSTVLPRYIQNSGWLMLGVGSLSLFIGVTTAWLVSMCQFPGKRLFEWALFLPMAIPAYILAYTYTDFLQVSGPIQSFIRTTFELRPRDYFFPEIRSLGGAIVLLSLALYPYIYLLARAAFLEQSCSMLEASQCLRANAWSSFLRVSLPLARPAIAAGVALVLMETLSDFGTVDYFGIQTFTTGIYRTWFGLGEKLAAVQLSAWLLVFVLVLLALERASRSQLKQSSKERFRSLLVYPLTGWRAGFAMFACLLPVTLGFILPAYLLTQKALSNANRSFNPEFWSFARNSLSLAVITAGLALVLALILAYGERIRPNWLNGLAVRIASMGYAVPGSVIAVSVLISFGWLDGKLNLLTERFFGISTGLILSGTMVGLVFAYLVRFLTAAFNTLESGLKTITPSMDEAARSLGKRSLARLFTIHIPLLRSSFLSAAIFVFVDTMKELPATLIVRPFNLDTLAIRVYRLASDERLVEASGGALAIVVVGLLPVLLLSLAISKSRSRKL
ncbi:MAG: iron ABC transporter permease [Trueperaceae bacterium]|nr:iron ABC transporter permease [Trueperaceae bacterium]